MVNLGEIIDRYVAVWNEGDPERRRRRIYKVWAPGGTTCYRLLDAHGYDAIEARVAGSWEKWLRDGKYVFRPKRTIAHHHVVKFEFELVTVPEGAVEANGLCYLLLSGGGRVWHDYQFNPTANDPSVLTERYLALWNAPDPRERQDAIATLWTEGGFLIAEKAMYEGHRAILDEISRQSGSSLATTRCQTHHHVAHIGWEARAGKDGEVQGRGSDLLVLDEEGRIRCDYRFEESA